MRAAVFEALDTPLAIHDVPEPVPSADEIIIAVGRCGICGSDLHMAHDPVFGAKCGDIFGHEFAGEVVELGKEARGVNKGDLVTVSPLKSCGECAHCRSGAVQWCANFGLQGGGYAEYVAARPNQCVVLPHSLSLDDGAIIEPLAVALHGVRLSGLKSGDNVLILGAGPIGLCAAFWAKHLGAAKVVVQDITEYQTARAFDMGADGFIADAADPIGASRRAFPNGADIVFECVGIPGLLDQAAAQARNQGTILLLGLCTRPDTINSFAMLNKELKIITSAFFTRQDFEYSVDVMAQGKIAPRSLISDNITLAQTPDMFEALKKRTTQCKVIIAP